MAHRGRMTSVLRTMLAAPAAVLPLLPSFTCPICLAAYAGVLSSLGLGFLLNDRVQRPLIVLFLAIAVASVAWSGYRRGRWAPLGLAVAGAAMVGGGRLVWDLPAVLYAGVALLVLASLWTLFMKRSAVRNSHHVEQETSHEHASTGCRCGRGDGAVGLGVGAGGQGDAEV